MEIESLCSPLWSSWLSHVLYLSFMLLYQSYISKTLILSHYSLHPTFPSLLIQSSSNEHTQWTSCKLFASLAFTNPTDKLCFRTRFLANSEIHVCSPWAPDSIILSQRLDPTILFKLQLNATSSKDLYLYSIPGHLFCLFLTLHNAIISGNFSQNYEVLSIDSTPRVLKYSLAQTENVFNVSIFFFLGVLKYNNPLEKSLFGF